MDPRLLLLPLVGTLLLLAPAASVGGAAPRLRGSVACLDCAAGHDLSGVVVAVKCAGDAGLRAAQTDARGAFDVTMPAAAASPASAAPCAARVLGATEQLCAPRGLAVARVVPGRTPGSSSYSYALGSRLAVFTRCRPASGGSATATTMDAPDEQNAPRPRVPAARPVPPATQTPVAAPPRAGGSSTPPFGIGGGLPLIYFFPFIPIIGIP